MISDSSDIALETGPRGRRLCWMVLDRLHPESDSSPFWRALLNDDSDEMLNVLNTSRPAIDLNALSDPQSEELLLNCVADSVDSARYWQDPDDGDMALADPRLATALAPIAARVAAAAGAVWWSEPMHPSSQVFVDRREVGDAPPSFQGAHVVLSVWRDQVTGPGKRHKGQWMGGPWWSTPVWSILASDMARYGETLPLLARTTRSRPNLGAVELLLEEDRVGAPAALCWPVRAQDQVRVFEIDRPDNWLQLVERYGIDVTGKRMVQWSAATGLERRWVIPDWSSVAEDYDAVHLTLNGYLTTSGRALGLDSDSATFLAGWNPDESYWLSDVLELNGSPVLWVSQEHGRAREWRPAHEVPRNAS